MTRCPHNRQRSKCKECGCKAFVHGQDIDKMRKIDLLVELDILNVKKVSRLKIGQLRTRLRVARQKNPLRKRKLTGTIKTVIAKKHCTPSYRFVNVDITRIGNIDIIAGCVRI